MHRPKGTTNITADDRFLDPLEAALVLPCSGIGEVVAKGKKSKKRINHLAMADSSLVRLTKILP
jgi:hypothetical protein